MPRTARKRTPTYVALVPFHFPGGFAAIGQTVELGDADAARGLEQGAIRPVESVEARPAAESEE